MVIHTQTVSKITVVTWYLCLCVPTIKLGEKICNDNLGKKQWFFFLHCE